MKIKRHSKYCNVILIEKCVPGSRMLFVTMGCFLARTDYIPFYISIKDVAINKEFVLASEYDNDYISIKKIYGIVRNEFITINSFDLNTLYSLFLTDNIISDILLKSIKEALCNTSNKLQLKRANALKIYIKNFMKGVKTR